MSSSLPEKRTIPLWVWAIAMGIGGLQPLVHVLVVYFPPQGAVHTGLSVPDSILFLQPMAMFQSDFYSPFATCKAPNGLNDMGLYLLPYNWVYGAMGFIGNALGFSPFMFLGIANGLAGTAFLLAAYVFFREIVPRQASLAFVIFSLTGGPGGVLYILTAILGLHDAPSFEINFSRYAAEIHEGSVFIPALQMDRFHYPLALAMGLMALTLFIRWTRHGKHHHLAIAAALVFGQTLFHVILGFLTWGLAMLFLYCQCNRPSSTRWKDGALLTVPFVISWTIASSLLRSNPVYVQNLAENFRLAMWFSSFLSAALFYLFLVPQQVARAIPLMPAAGRAAAWALVGYLAVFAALFWTYQIYYGNIIAHRDYAATIAVSDGSISGAVLALLLAWRSGALKRNRNAQSDPDTEIRSWCGLWLLLCLVASISAFGQGYYLRLGPIRVAALLAPPFSIFAAITLARIRETRPRLFMGYTASMVVCGVACIAVGTLCFFGPLGNGPAAGPYTAYRSQYMTEADVTLISNVGEGTVLAPADGAFTMGDVLALKKGNPVVFGVGTYNFSALPYTEMHDAVQRFFSPSARPEERRAFLTEWCVDYVCCPDTFPVHEDVLQALRDEPALEEIASAGKGAVFRVKS